MKYKYVGNGAYFLGLPATDLDDEELNDDQKKLLKVGVQVGIYKLDKPTGKSVKEAEGDKGS